MPLFHIQVEFTVEADSLDGAGDHVDALVDAAASRGLNFEGALTETIDARPTVDEKFASLLAEVPAD